MTLYKNMEKLDQLAWRLYSSSYSEEDLLYLANCLEKMCHAHNPEEVFNIKQGPGIRRTDYKRHIRNVNAIKQIAVKTDLMAATIDESGNILIYEDDESDRPSTKVAILEVSDETGLAYDTLDQYWTDPKYRKYKTPLV